MKRILIVDDEEAIRLLYREEFVEAGFAVDVAVDGVDALRQIRQARPDLMIVDLRMPHMDGIELLARARDLYRDLPIVICTAYGDFRSDFGTWASDAFVTKSADLQELKARVKELLG